MAKFFVTFGQAHPLKDNWIEVEADNEKEARELVFIMLGKFWAFMYDEKHMTPEYFPKGKVGNTLR